MLCLCWFNIYPDLSRNNSRLGYLRFLRLRTVFFALSTASFLALYYIAAMLLFKLHRLECFLGNYRRIIVFRQIACSIFSIIQQPYIAYILFITEHYVNCSLRPCGLSGRRFNSQSLQLFHDT